MFNFMAERVNGKETFLKVFWLYKTEGTGKVDCLCMELHFAAFSRSGRGLDHIKSGLYKHILRIIHYMKNLGETFQTEGK